MTFNGVTLDKIEQLKGELAHGGMAVQQNADSSYSIAGHGVAATAVFDPTASTLTVAIQHKPWIISEGAIQSRIADALR